jgi:hypothetical protein
LVDEDLNAAHFGPAEEPTQAELNNAVDRLGDPIGGVDVNMEDEDQGDDASSVLSKIPMPASLLRPVT